MRKEYRIEISLGIVVQRKQVVALGRGHRGIATHCILEAQLGQVRPALFEVCDAKIIRGERETGFKLHRTLKTRHGFIEPALIQQGEAKTVVRVGVVGIEPKSLDEMRHCFIHSALPLQSQSQDVLSVELVRLDLQRPLVLAYRFGVFLQAYEDVGQIYVGVGVVRLKPDKLLVELLGHLEMTALAMIGS
jgi:hypothetical protein